MKLVKRQYEYVNTKEQKCLGYNLYVVDDNGIETAIKPAFKEDYKYLCCIAKEVK